MKKHLLLIFTLFIFYSCANVFNGVIVTDDHLDKKSIKALSDKVNYFFDDNIETNFWWREYMPTN